MYDVEKEVSNIILSRTGKDFIHMNAVEKDLPLLGTVINIPPRELVLVCLDIELQFQIEVSENAIVNGKFKTFPEICNYIQEKVKSKQKAMPFENKL